MAKNWRLALCTRWRPEVGLLLVGALVVSFGLVTLLIEKYQSGRLEHRAALLHVGMTEAELIRIMGKPSFVGELNAQAMGGALGGLSIVLSVEGDLEGQKKEGRTLVQYNWVAKRAPGWTGKSWLSGIFLDEKREKIVLIRRTIGWLDEIPGGRFEAILLLCFCAVAPWLGLHFLCKRQKRRTMGYQK